MNYKNNTMRVFKSAGDQNQYLVTLQLDLDTPNNLTRKVHDRNHAKYRCKQATVLAIVHKDTQEPVNKVRSNRDPNFIYTVGNTVIVPNYHEDIDKVCDTGIHFYLTEETARFHNHRPQDGLHQKWYDNGQKKEKSNYQNGRLHGLSLTWYENGQNGQLHGPYQSWYENGQKSEESNYQKGQPHGPCQTWYKDGQKDKETNYLNGELL